MHFFYQCEKEDNKLVVHAMVELVCIILDCNMDERGSSCCQVFDCIEHMGYVWLKSSVFLSIIILIIIIMEFNNGTRGLEKGGLYQVPWSF